MPEFRVLYVSLSRVLIPCLDPFVRHVKTEEGHLTASHMDCFVIVRMDHELRTLFELLHFPSKTNKGNSISLLGKNNLYVTK